MINSKRLSIVAAGVAVSGVLAMIVPGLAQAATTNTYAFVNQAQEVRTVTAATWSDAIATAPNIDAHSGVLLLSTQTAN